MPYFDEEGRIECKVNMAELLSSEATITALIEEMIDENTAIPTVIHTPNYVYEFKRIFKDILKHIKFLPEELCTNRLIMNRTIYIESTGKTAKFPAGTKASKYFKAVVENYSDSSVVREHAEKFSQAFSVLLESLMQDITVALSINPLDIVMASVHTAGWKSCYSLDGVCRTAPLAMLLDDNTVLAYAYLSKAEYRPLGIELPKKIWRQWVSINFKQNAALFMKEYPKQLFLVSKQVRAMTAGILNSYAGLDPSSTWVRLKDISDGRVKIHESKYIYSDPAYDAIVLKASHDASGTLSFDLGAGGIYCLNCGELRHDSTRSSFYCLSCPQRTCVHCGVVLSDEDVIYWTQDNHPYCEYCFEELCVNCDNCGDAIHCDEAHYADYAHYCDYCYNELFTECNSCGDTVAIDSAFEVDGEYYCTDCFNDLFVYCSYCGIVIRTEDAIGVDYEDYCSSCYDELFVECSHCGGVVAVDIVVEVNGEYYCDDCYDELFASV